MPKSWFHTLLWISSCTSVQKQDFDSGFSDTIPKPNQWMTGQRDHSRTGLVWYSGPHCFIKAWPLKQYLLILYSINVNLSMEWNLQKCSECSLTAQIKLQSTLSLEWGYTSTLIAVMSHNSFDIEVWLFTPNENFAVTIRLSLTQKKYCSF